MRWILLISCFFWLSPTSGQVHLAIKNTWGKQKETFYVGDRLVFALKNDDGIQKGMIQSLDVENNEIVLGSASILIEDIAVVYSQKKHRNSFPNKLITAGILFPIIDQFNNMVISDHKFGWNKGVLVASGGLVASGLVIKFLKRKKYPLKDKFRFVY